MIYKKYGSTGKTVSSIGFGGMRFLSEEYSKDDALCAELVLEAHKHGVTYFDTAPGYCDNHSEKIFGEAFKKMEYGKFYVSTKCGLWNARTASETRRMIEKSLKNLNVPKITFYNMWCIKTLDEYRQMIKKDGIFDGILKARDEGLVEHICCSAHASGAEIAEIVADGRVEGVTLGYNAINFAYRREGVEACHKAGLGVVVMNPLGGGVIPSHPEYFSFLKNGDDSIAVSALKFLVAQDAVTVALPGLSTSAELHDALVAADTEAGLMKVDKAYLDSLAGKLQAELNTMCTGCSYCTGCPENIPIPRLMEAYNQAILSGGESVKPALDWYRSTWGSSAEVAKKCTSCRHCESLCTQKLPISERMGKLASAL